MVFILVVTIIKNRFGVGIAVCAGVVRGGSDGSRISVHIGRPVVVDCEMIVIGRVDAGIVVCHCRTDTQTTFQRLCCEWIHSEHSRGWFSLSKRRLARQKWT